MIAVANNNHRFSNKTITHFSFYKNIVFGPKLRLSILKKTSVSRTSLTIFFLILVVLESFKKYVMEREWGDI